MYNTWSGPYISILMGNPIRMMSDVCDKQYTQSGYLKRHIFVILERNHKLMMYVINDLHMLET